MGLAIPALRFLIREHRRRPFTGPVLTLGRQNVHATYDRVCALLTSEGVTPQELPPQQSRTTNIATWKRGIKARSTSDVAFFWSLAGLEAFALDVSAQEGAEYVWDLNRPIPAALEGKFGLIVDGGTLEHVFDVKEAFGNVSRMLMPWGRVIHMSPGSNYMEHGFYQFSPTLFYDYYGANGFTNLRCFIAMQPLVDAQRVRWDFWEWDVKRPLGEVLISDQSMGVFFSAEKTESSCAGQVPLQGRYGRSLEGRKAPPTFFNGGGNLLKSWLPARLKTGIKRVVGRDINTKPWGLRYAGKF